MPEKKRKKAADHQKKEMVYEQISWDEAINSMEIWKEEKKEEKRIEAVTSMELPMEWEKNVNLLLAEQTENTRQHISEVEKLYGDIDISQDETGEKRNLSRVLE